MAYLKRTLEHVDEELISDHVKFLLIFTLNVRFSNSFAPGKKNNKCCLASSILSLSLSLSPPPPPPPPPPPSEDAHTHRLANPALRTAVEMALMAVSRELSSMVREPVDDGVFLCSLSTKRVSVMVSTLISSMVGCGAAMVNRTLIRATISACSVQKCS